MAGTPIGRILLMPKGNYSGTAVYNALDWVRHNGSAWVCTTDNTTGIAPAIGVPEWQVLAQDGTVSGTVDWSNVNFKPFDTVGSGLDVDVSNTLKLDMSMLTGSNISYDNSASGAASNNVQDALDELFRGGGGGGLLPYFFIDSEAGSTVTVNVPDGSTITPTPAGSGHWECSVPMYGTYTIHSVLAGQGDATVSVNVDDVKQYHITDNHYDFTINVTAPNSSTIRITGGGETYTGTGTGSTQAFAVHTPSTVYTVDVTMDGNTKSDTVTSAATTGQSDSVTIEFGTINVSVAADFVTAGSTITCVSGGTSCTPKTAASTLVFRVPTTGTWTISGTISGQTYSTTATVTSLSTPVSTSLQTIPEGSTVLPTDDIQTWLNCAGIYNKTSYTTLADVLGDSTTLLALMSDNNAVDYLVRSTTWATDICADSTAMTDIGANNYCADTLLADSDWCDAICNSTYFESVLNAKVPIMTSNTTPSGICSADSTYTGYEAYQAFSNNVYGWSPAGSGIGTFWFQYDFGKTIKPAIMEIKNKFASAVTNGKYEVSNDMTNWITVQEFSLSVSMADFDRFINYKPTAYRYHRITATYSGNTGGGIKAQFYGREDV